MRIAIMQPTYLPWIGYFDMIDQVDAFVFLDDVQVVKRSWGVRNRIKTAQGEQMLSVPILKERPRHERLYANTRTNPEHGWTGKHLRSIQQAYSKTPFFEQVFHPFERALQNAPEMLGDMNRSLIAHFAGQLRIETPFVAASGLDGIGGQKDHRLVALCRALEADSYLSALGSADYIEAEGPAGAFGQAGIELVYHHYEHPEYPQLHGEFLPYMCILDLLFNVGTEQALAIIRSGRRTPWSVAAVRKQKGYENH